MTRTTWKRFGIAVVCGLAGYAINFFRQGSSAPLLVGRMITLPVAILFGPWFGVVASFIAATAGIGLFANALWVAPLEALVIGFFAQRGRSPLLGGFLVWTLVASTLI